MNSSKKVLKLRQAMLKANTQLEQLRKSGMLDSSVEANVRYNKILIDTVNQIISSGKTVSVQNADVGKIRYKELKNIKGGV